MNILQRIFTDYYEEMLYILHLRKFVIENVNKMLNCNDPSFGGAILFCPDCGNLKFIPFRCHSSSYSFFYHFSRDYFLYFQNKAISYKLRREHHCSLLTCNILNFLLYSYAFLNPTIAKTPE